MPASSHLALPNAPPQMQLEGSAKSAGVLFARYDMDLDGYLRQQDLYGESGGLSCFTGWTAQHLLCVHPSAFLLYVRVDAEIRITGALCTKPCSWAALMSWQAQGIASQATIACRHLPKCIKSCSFSPYSGCTFHAFPVVGSPECPPELKVRCPLWVLATAPSDLLLELNLALPYEEYQRFIDFLFAAAGGRPCR